MPRMLLSPSTTLSWQHHQPYWVCPARPRVQQACQLVGADSSSRALARSSTQGSVGDTCSSSSSSTHSSNSSSHSRRQALATLLLSAAVVAAPAAAPPGARAVSTDVVEGTQRVLDIGRSSFSIWLQSVVDSVANNDETGVLDLDAPPRRHFGSVSVPGLSSFSFIHGALVGCGLILLLAADKLTAPPTQQQQQQQQPGQPGAEPVVLNPEVEAALKRLLASPEVRAQFHDPAVHAALQEVRSDPRAITKYRDDAVVMGAFGRLLEIEDILERL